IDYEEGKLYENETEITITGDVVFTAYESYGHWLVFDENGKGGTYNAPVFVKAGEVTVKPRPDSEMLRLGYSFGGWYTNADGTGDPFDFGHELTGNQTVYAHWIANSTAKYTVILWTQNINRNGYDVKESKVIEDGAVGSTIEYTVNENKDEDYVTFQGTAYHYIGFCLKEADKGQEVTITPEGDAVLNLHFDRIKYTLKFYLYRRSNNDWDTNNYSYASGSHENKPNENKWYHIADWYGNTSLGNMPTTSYPGGVTEELVDDYRGFYIALEAYYGDNISSKWPTYEQIVGPNSSREPVSFIMMNGTGLKPNPSGGGDSTLKGEVSIMDENILGVTNDSTGNYLIVRYNTYNDWDYHIYYEVPAGQQAPAGKPTKELNGKTYYLDHDVQSRSSNADPAQQNPPIYRGYIVVKSGGRPYYGSYGSVGYKHYELDYFYDLESFSLSFFDGIYVDGNGNKLALHSTQPFRVVNNIGYGVAISDADKNYVPQNANEVGFEFEGWYVDEGGTEPYVFDTMTYGGIQVYAKWRQKEYRVFLHPNAGTRESEPSLSWGQNEQGEEISPAMNFRIAYGGKVSLPTGTRDGYEFVGWFSNAGCTRVFSEATRLNDGNTTDYDKTTDFTDPMDKWGNGATTNSDKTGYNGKDRWWITRKKDIYAKWRAVLIGADGINVIYDENTAGGGKEGTAPSDTTSYVDSANVVANAASQPADPTKKRFSHWVVQKWNGSTFVDTAVEVLPGETFMVNIENARRTEKEGHTAANPKYSYTIHVRAEYVDVEEKTPTHIYWYRNDGSDAFHKDETGSNGQPLLINEPVSIQRALTRTGYKFLGWARVNEPVSSFSQALTESNLYLFYNEDDGKFHVNGYEGTAVSQVASDEKLPGHAMFAVWREDEVTINYAVAADSDGMGTVSLEEETIKVVSGNPAGSTASPSSSDYIFDYWTCDNGTDTISTDAHYVPQKEDGFYVEHTYYAHFKLSEADYTVKFYYQDENLVYQIVDSMTDTRTATIGDTVSATEEDKGHTTYNGETYTLNNTES
ncbi:MAG: InlB B-repeat-containing protein, partial [Acutalibacteraceae bacterium]|nr:InlB B-repeat-containing protein [Acutalibacteraceae bacterium]